MNADAPLRTRRYLVASAVNNLQYARNELRAAGEKKTLACVAAALQSARAALRRYEAKLQKVKP